MGRSPTAWLPWYFSSLSPSTFFNGSWKFYRVSLSTKSPITWDKKKKKTFKGDAICKMQFAWTSKPPEMRSEIPKRVNSVWHVMVCFSELLSLHFLTEVKSSTLWCEYWFKTSLERSKGELNKRKLMGIKQRLICYLCHIPPCCSICVLTIQTFQTISLSRPISPAEIIMQCQPPVDKFTCSLSLHRCCGGCRRRGAQLGASSE